MNRTTIVLLGAAVVTSIIVVHSWNSVSKPDAAGRVRMAGVEAVQHDALTTSRSSVEAVPTDESASSEPAPSEPVLETSGAGDSVTADSPAEPEEGMVVANDPDQQLRDLRARAINDPDGALASAMERPEGPDRLSALAAVCFGVSETDPAKAVKMGETFRLSEQAGEVMPSLVQAWAKADLPSALAWATQQPAGDQRNQLIGRIAFIRSQSAPADAARLVVDQIPPAAQEEPAMMVLHRWANEDLPAASAWVARFPEGPLRERAMEELASIRHYQQQLTR